MHPEALKSRGITNCSAFASAESGERKCFKNTATSLRQVHCTLARDVEPGVYASNRKIRVF